MLPDGRAAAQLFKPRVFAPKLTANGAVVGFVFSECQLRQLVVDLYEPQREDVGLGLPT